MIILGAVNLGGRSVW